MPQKTKIYFLFFFITVLCIFVHITLSSNEKSFVMPISNKTPISISVLTANVGNLNLGCRSVLNNLCYKEVENRIAKNITNLKPDIIALQELLAPWQCDEIQERNIRKVCSDSQTIPQVRRLVGDDYSIACTSRNQFECIAIHTNIGKISGCPLGELCNTARTGVELSNCDNGFSVSAVTVELYNKTTFDVVNVHPQSTDTTCRSQMISLIFETKTPSTLIQSQNVAIMGDFNFDPWRDDDLSVDTWLNRFKQGWSGKNFVYHSGIVEKSPPYPTSFLPFRARTLDFVVSNFATGICNTLGETANSTRIDGGQGTDHRAIYGILEINNQ